MGIYVDMPDLLKGFTHVCACTHILAGVYTNAGMHTHIKLIYEKSA